MLKNLITAMKKEGISQVEIAGLLGVHTTTVANKLSGKCRLYFDEAVLIWKTYFKNYSSLVLFKSFDENKEGEKI